MRGGRREGAGRKAATERTVPKQLTPFKPGQSGNPNGRPKGSRNKLGEDFVAALHQDFNAHGLPAIVAVRTDRPQDYLKVIAMVLPKEVKVTHDVDGLTDEQLEQRIRSLLDAERPDREAPGAAAPAGDAETPARYN